MLADLIKTLSDVVTGRRRNGAPARETGPRAAPGADAEALPGELGPDATVEVDPDRIGSASAR